MKWRKGKNHTARGWCKKKTLIFKTIVDLVKRNIFQCFLHVFGFLRSFPLKLRDVKSSLSKKKKTQSR